MLKLNTANIETPKELWKYLVSFSSWRCRVLLFIQLGFFATILYECYVASMRHAISHWFISLLFAISFYAVEYRRKQWEDLRSSVALRFVSLYGNDTDAKNKEYLVKTANSWPKYI